MDALDNNQNIVWYAQSSIAVSNIINLVTLNTYHVPLRCRSVMDKYGKLTGTTYFGSGCITTPAIQN